MTESPSARDFWDNEIVEQSHTTWAAHPIAREYINRSIDPQAPAWPIEWFARYLHGVRYRRGLSIGCGGGPLERSVIKFNLCTTIDAFDASVHSLHIARHEAHRSRMANRIRYFAADFNEALFLPPRKYDIVFFHQSLHHVAKLEKLFRAVLRTLKPGGLLYLDEYVGPSRSDWSETVLAPQQTAYQGIDRDIRTSDALDLPIQEDDPSEAIRSGEIAEQLAIGFRIVQQRDYGGNLLAVICPSLKGDADAVVQDLVKAEERLRSRGETSFYTIIVAEPKRGMAKLAASLNYFLVPKLKRLSLELRRRFTKQGS